MAFWTCPNCGRRVPGYQPTCHCGVARTASSALAPATPPFGEVRFAWRDLPRAAWAAIAVVVLALLFGLWQLFRPSPPQRIVPLLGVVDRRPSPAPTPKPSPSPSPRQTR